MCVGLTVVLILGIAVAVGIFIFVAGMCVIQRSERRYIAS